MSIPTPKSSAKGFTLIELLIVIAIISFLAASVLVAVDPVKRIQDARDARRFAESNAVLNAILNNQVDNRLLFAGDSSAPIITQGGSNVQVIVTSATGILCNSATTRPGCNKPMDTSAANVACVANLLEATPTTTTLVPNYIASIPIDPRGSGSAAFCSSGCTTLGNLAVGATNTGYYIARTAGNRIEIGSCLPEDTTTNPTISVKR